MNSIANLVYQFSVTNEVIPKKSKFRLQTWKSVVQF